MKVSHTRSAAPSSRRHPLSRSRSQTGSGAGRHGEIEAPRSPAGPHVPPRSFDGGLAVAATSDVSGAGSQAGEPDHGILAELHRLHMGLFEGWLSEDQLGRLAEMAYRAPPSAGHPDLERAVDDETGLHAAGEPAKQRRAGKRG